MLLTAVAVATTPFARRSPRSHCVCRWSKSRGGRAPRVLATAVLPTESRPDHPSMGRCHHSRRPRGVKGSFAACGALDTGRWPWSGGGTEGRTGRLRTEAIPHGDSTSTPQRGGHRGHSGPATGSRRPSRSDRAHARTSRARRSAGDPPGQPSSHGAGEQPALRRGLQLGGCRPGGQLRERRPVSAAVSRDDVLTRLAEGIRELTTSEAWTTWLQTQSRFYRYSFGNVLLIASQRPDATQVAGFHCWKSLGRSVRKGSRGIAILAPVVRRLAVRDEESDDASVVAAAPSAFRVVYVFDVTDTEGRELPAVPCHPLRGDAPATLFERLAAVGESRGFSVRLDPMRDSAANGDTAFGERRIRVRDTLSPAQQVKTLAHELGHSQIGRAHV